MSRWNNDPGYRNQEDCVEDGLKFLAGIDEADIYEVDANEVYQKPDGSFLLRSASGCSCWDGDWTETEYPDFESLENTLMNTAQIGSYSPTLKGAEQLIREAKAAIG